MKPTTFRASLYFLITFLTSVGQVVIPVLQDEKWPTGPKLVLASLTGFVGGLVSLRAYYDGSALRAAQEAKQAVPLAIVVAFSLLFFTGCAKFSTKQTDLSYDEKGKPQRTITTRASAYTFFSGDSKLATWKATQSDKSQGATVGGLDQSGGQTNQMNDIIGVIVGAAIKAVAK